MIELEIKELRDKLKNLKLNNALKLDDKSKNLIKNMNSQYKIHLKNQKLKTNDAIVNVFYPGM